MSKTSAKIAETAETIEFPSFDASKATDQFRSFAEKGVETSKEAYGKMKSGAETAQKAMEASFESAKAASTEISLKSIAAMRSSSEAAFAHVEALVSARTFSDMIEVHTAHLRKRMELAVEQAKEMQSISQKTAEEMGRPYRDMIEKGMKDLKLA